MKTLQNKYTWLLIIASLAFVSAPAFAVTYAEDILANAVFASYICKIRMCFLTNRLIYTVCGIAISILAVMVMFGKANWNMVLITVIGVFVCTGAYKISSEVNLYPNLVNGGSPIADEDPCVLAGSCWLSTPDAIKGAGKVFGVGAGED